MRGNTNMQDIYLRLSKHLEKLVMGYPYKVLFIARLLEFDKIFAGPGKI